MVQIEAGCRVILSQSSKRAWQRYQGYFFTGTIRKRIVDEKEMDVFVTMLYNEQGDLAMTEDIPLVDLWHVGQDHSRCHLRREENHG